MPVVVAAIIRRDSRILISQRPSHVHLPGLWEFPGGKVEAGESFSGALKRELREELGIEVEVFERLFTTTHRYPEKTVELHFFECAIVGGEPRAIQVADFCWVEPSNLQNFKFPEADREIVAHLMKP